MSTVSKASDPNGQIPDSAFTETELKELKALVILRDESYKASKLAALKIKALETAVRIRQLSGVPNA